jgi:hypothetical protein
VAKARPSKEQTVLVVTVQNIVAVGGGMSGSCFALRASSVPRVSSLVATCLARYARCTT